MALYASFDNTAQLITFNYNTNITKQLWGNSNDSKITPSYSWATDTGTGIYHPSMNNIGVVTNSLDRIRIDGNGNVGIGTTTPIAGIHIFGNTATETVLINQIGGGDILEVQKSGNPSLIVKQNGNVGINTSQASYGLHVYTNPNTANFLGLPPMAILEQQVTSGSNPVDNLLLNTFVQRTLNTTVVDTIGVSLNAGRFTLSSGTYYITAEGMCNVVGRHRIALYYTTSGGGYLLYGTSETTTVNTGNGSKSTLAGIVTPTVSTTYELRHYATASTGNFGIPVAISSVPETYVRVTIIKYQ